MTRTELDVTRAFVSLSSRLLSGADVVELLADLTADCARLLDIASAGLLLADARGTLHVVAASSERTRVLEVFQVQRDQGPCRDSFLLGEAISVPDLDAAADRWPQFVTEARGAGFKSVHALPLRFRQHELGTLGLFGTSVGALDAADLSLGQALADVACVALVQDRTADDQGAINEQLQNALQARVLLEQAKGIVAQIGDLDMPAAFQVLRRHARDHDLHLTELVRAVSSRQLPARQLLEHDALPRPPRP